MNVTETADNCGWIGCDVGSTAVKVVYLAEGGQPPLERLYARHGTQQAAAVVDLLRRLAQRRPGVLEQARICWTGSGGRSLARRAGGRFLQEVNAVAVATERLHPEAGSVVDLGGQDAKIIIWQRDPRSGRRRKLFSMNDKCAGGTGSVIDRIARKLGLDAARLGCFSVNGQRTHPIAARCGVFAETDINSLQKQGVPPDELLASLFEAIVQQNLSVLTRGATLVPPVLLLGGPHAFLPGLVTSWRRALARLWEERGVRPPGTLAEAVRVPEAACYFAALGAIFDAAQAGATGAPSGAQALAALERRLGTPEDEQSLPGLLPEPGARARLEALAAQRPARGLAGSCGERIPVVIGLDAGSTSTKAVLLDPAGDLLAKAYRLSGGDPVRDAQEVLGDLAAEAATAGARLAVRALGVTGYAKDLLGSFLGADLVLVETVAHARSALQVLPDAEVIVDVGGQDIKVLTLRDGWVRDFRLNSQCSAGNGYFLQSTAERFGIPLAEYADHALAAARCPPFHFGCAVFLEADIVNFQQLGWRPGEILAGLARVLPKNVWLYVVGEPNLARLGRAFILQGGTQRNLAAVQAQIDFIRERVPEARLAVHPHTGEAGAIGVALEILRREIWKQTSSFVGFEALRAMRVTTRDDETTRCRGCGNRCRRTLVEAHLPGAPARRFLVAPCETGRQLAVGGGGGARSARNRTRASGGAPDFSEQGAASAFQATGVCLGEAQAKRAAWPAWLGARAGRRARARRATVRIGLPRALNLFQVAPLFLGYLQALGVSAERLRISGRTTERLFREGTRRGAIDTCFPCKVALAHVDDLLRRGGIDWLFLPILANLPTDLHGCVDSSVCPSSQATPEVIKAACTREEDLFARHGVRYLDPLFHVGEPRLFAREMRRFWEPLLGVSRGENARALAVGYRALAARLVRLRSAAQAEIHRLERERRVGIVALGRPYHDDAGLNHGIFRDLNRRGYPIFTVTTLPRTPEFLDPLFAREVRAGRVRDAFDISDELEHSFSANSNQKVWAAKVVARHPNLVALDVSNFRCGHDAPILGIVESILVASGTPTFTFHEIDENRPTGAIGLRVETIDYFLREYEAERLGAQRRAVPQRAPAPAATAATGQEVLV